MIYRDFGDIIRILLTILLLYYCYVQAGWAVCVTLSLLFIEREALVFTTRKSLKEVDFDPLHISTD